MRDQNNKPLGFYYESCGVVTSSLDLETYEVFTRKRHSKLLPTDADLQEHNWVTSLGGGAITETEVLHHIRDCSGADCILCSFEHELIRIGYHDRQTARQENRRRFQETFVQQTPDTKLQNQAVMNKYDPVKTSKDTSQQEKTAGHSERCDSAAEVRRSASRGQQRIVASLSQTRICFNAPVPSAAVKQDHQNASYAQRFTRDCKSKNCRSPDRPFLVHSASLNDMSLQSPLMLGKTKVRHHQAFRNLNNTNCQSLWKVDHRGTKIQKFEVDSTARPKFEPSLLDNISPDIEFYFSDDSTPRVLSPDESSSESPTPKNSWCKIPVDDEEMKASDWNNSVDDTLMEDELCCDNDAPSGPGDAVSRASTAEEELCFDDDNEDEPSATCAKSQSGRRVISQSAGVLRQSSGRSSSTASQCSLIFLGGETGLRRSKGMMHLNLTAMGARNPPSYRINSAPSDFHSSQLSAQTSNASHRLGSFLQHNTETQERFDLEMLRSKCSSDSHQQRSTPASPQTTPPHSQPSLRSVRSSPGMRFHALSPMKSRLTPQSPKCKRQLSFTKGFSPYQVLPCVQEQWANNKVVWNPQLDQDDQSDRSDDSC